jgi:hypothetical protein
LFEVLTRGGHCQNFIKPREKEYTILLIQESNFFTNFGITIASMK